jgi:hypothetical protein
MRGKAAAALAGLAVGLLVGGSVGYQSAKTRCEIEATEQMIEHVRAETAYVQRMRQEMGEINQMSDRILKAMNQ